MGHILAATVFLAALVASLACDSVPDDYKRRICSEASRGASSRCDYLGISERVCSDIASEAFRLCYEALPEYIR